MDQLIAIFCDIDDFCKVFEPVYFQPLLHVGQRQRTRQTPLALSEMLTLLVYFHWSHYRTFTYYYTEYIMVHLHPYFPQLMGYHRFVELMPRALVPLCCSLSTRKGRCTGIAFIDSTPLAVWANHRMATPRVFEGMATRGKTSMGWFYRFKWHVIVHDEGELLAFRVTPGNIDDCQPVQQLTAGLGRAALWGPRRHLPSPA